MDLSLGDLLDCLAVQETGGGVFRAANLDIGYHRVFGGQILAQVVAVAAGTFPDRDLASVSVAFPREGDAAVPLDFRVTVAHAGRTFATLAVEVTQSAGGGDSVQRIVATAQVSMHRGEPGLHASVGPPGAGLPADAVARRLDLVPWEVRVVGEVDLSDREVGAPELHWWMRAPALDAPAADTAPGPGGTAPTTGADRPHWVDQALVSHATDLTVIGTALRAVPGFSEADSTVRVATAVTNHSLWFHQPFRLSEWLAVSQCAPVVAGGRAFGRGEVFSGDQLVASFAQGSMIRPIAAAPGGS